MDGPRGFWGDSVLKNLPANARDTGLIPRLGRSSKAGNGNPVQYSFLGNLMDRGAWRAAMHGITKTQMWLSDWACTDGPRGYYAKWKKSEKEKYCVIFLYVESKKNKTKTNEQTEQNRNRVTMGGYWRVGSKGDERNRWRRLRGTNF